MSYVRLIKVIEWVTTHNNQRYLPWKMQGFTEIATSALAKLRIELSVLINIEQPKPVPKMVRVKVMCPHTC